MSYQVTKGGGLGEVTRRALEGAKLAGYAMARDGTERMTRHVRRNTPVDTRHLRTNIFEKVIKVLPGVSWEGGTYTEVDYAPHVEHGTGLWGPKHAKYKIEPKTAGGVLAFFARVTTPEGRPLLHPSGAHNLQQGNLVFARYVMHPGSPGQHMFAIGVEMTEHELPAIEKAGVRVMRRYVEHGSVS